MNDRSQALGTTPEQGTSPKSTPASTPRPTRLAIRLWTPARVSHGWTSESAVVYLVADLIRASDGSLVETHEPALVAQFEQPGQAYRTAKRLQWALLEFCQHRPDQCLGASEILYDATDSSAAPAERHLPDISSFLANTKPAQILATAATGKYLEEMPELQFRAAAALPQSRGAWQGGAQEAIWTAVSNLEQIQATLKAAAQRLSQKQEQALVSDQPTMDFTAGGHQAAPPTLVHNEPPARQQNSDSTESLSDLIEPDAHEESSGSPALWWSVAAVAVLFILGAILFMPRSQNKRVPPQAPAAAAPVSSPPEQPSANSEPTTAPPPQEVVPQANPAAVEKQAGTQKTAARHPASESSARAPAKKVAEYEGLSEKDIPMLLRMAQNHAGAGKYEDARREFEIVLRLDPGNAEAKQELHKLDLSERETR